VVAPAVGVSALGAPVMASYPITRATSSISTHCIVHVHAAGGTSIALRSAEQRYPSFRARRRPDRASR
jgi:hypothetical protein